MADNKANVTVRKPIKLGSSTVLVPHGENEYKADKLFFSAIKEEEWLNYLASRGYALVGRKFTGYIFQEDKFAGKYYYSVCLLPAPAETDYAESFINSRSDEPSVPVCTFSCKSYQKVLKGGYDDGVVNDAINKGKHLMRAFLVHFGLLMFALGMLCYNMSYWVRFDAAGVDAITSNTIWKLAINLSTLFGSFPTTPYISICMVLVIAFIPFTVYYFDQFMYSKSFVKRIRDTWQKK